MSDEGFTEKARLIASFSPKMVEALTYIQTWQRNESSRSLRSRYELGLYIQKIYNNASSSTNGGAYGEDVIGRLSKALDEDQTLLRTVLRFVEAYTPEQLEELCSTKKHNGEPIYWAHVRELIRIEDIDARNAIQRRCAQEDINSTELARIVKEHNDNKRVEQAKVASVELGIEVKPVIRDGVGGPKVIPPSTPMQFMQRFDTVVAKILPSVKVLTADGVSLAKMISTMTAEECTPDIVDKINNVRETAAAQISYWENIQKDAEKASGYALRVLKAASKNEVVKEPVEDKPITTAAPKVMTRPPRKQIVASIN